MQGPPTVINIVTMHEYLTEPICFKMASSTTVSGLRQRLDQDYWLAPDECVLKCELKGKKKYLLDENTIIC